MSTRLTPDEQIQQFGQALLGDGLNGSAFAHTWTPAPKHTDWVQTAQDAITSATRNGRRDVYFGAGLAGRRGTEYERVKVAECVGTLAVVSDVDIAGPAHVQENLPPDGSAALDLIAEIVPPTLLIHSGHGLQGWWAFEQPWMFANGDRQRAITLGRKFQAYVNGKAASHGWKLDSVGDLARVLRVPGTLNAKDPKHIVPVEILACRPDVRYSLDALEALCANFAEQDQGHDQTNDQANPVDDNLRFTQEQPCPICGGYESLEHGTTERCWGHYSRDRRRVFCTREEYRGKQKPRTNAIGAVVYMHHLFGKCPCGVTHRVYDGPVAGRALWNANFYVSLYGDELRYVAEHNRWHLSNGKWWEPNQNKIALKYGYDAVSELYRLAAHETDRNKKRDLGELAVKLDVSSKINAMVSAAGTFPPIAASGADFDTDDFKMVFANGVVDLRTGALLPHDPGAMHSRHAGPTLASIEYDPDALCPNWLTFLATIFPEPDSQEMIEYLQRIGGYTLTGDTTEQCMFILIGKGANGKTTFTQALSAVLGSYYDEVYVETLLSAQQEIHPTGIASLEGLRGAFAAENERDRNLAEARIKKLVGSGNVRARFMGKDFFTYTPKFKLWLQTNNKPKIRGKDKGIWRRLQVIPFQYTIPEPHNKHFYENCLRPELPGIAAWFVRGCLEWQRIGLAEPKRVRDAWQGYKDENDTVAQFISEKLTASLGAFTSSSAAYTAYVQFCEQEQEKPESHKALTQGIQDAFKTEVVVKRDGGQVARGFPGVDLAGGVWG